MMYYNIKNQNIYYSLPDCAYTASGNLVQNLTYADIEVKASCGYYTIRNDSPIQPENAIENIDARIVNIDKPYVDIIRTWIF